MTDTSTPCLWLTLAAVLTRSAVLGAHLRVIRGGGRSGEPLRHAVQFVVHLRVTWTTATHLSTRFYLSKTSAPRWPTALRFSGCFRSPLCVMTSGRRRRTCDGCRASLICLTRKNTGKKKGKNPSLRVLYFLSSLIEGSFLPFRATFAKFT